MKILITGGAGFVGSNLALKLKEKYADYQIVVFDNLKRRGSELNLNSFVQHNIQFIHGDVRNSEDFDEIPEFDILIDASAEPSVMAGITTSVSGLVNINFNGTINCLNLAKRRKSGFIFLSTSRVYPIEALESAKFVETETRFEWGDDQVLPGINSKGISENFSLTGSRSFYGSSKLASELFVEEFNKLSGLKTIINRCGVIAGPKQMGKVDQGFITLWVARHYWKNKLSYIGYGGNGKQVRDVMHIDDLFELIDLQIHNFEKFNGETFNVGGGRDISTSLCELTDICREVTGNRIEMERITETRTADLRIYLTNNDYVKERTGWVAQRGIHQLVEEVHQWIHQNEKFLEPILN